MSGKPGTVKFAWTPEQDAALSELWVSGKRIKDHMHLFGEHTYAAVMTRASVLKLGHRPDCPRGQSPIAWLLIKRALEKGPLTRDEIMMTVQADCSTIYRKMNEAIRDKKAHIKGWKRGRSINGTLGKLLPIYAIGPGRNAAKPSPLPRRRPDKHRQPNPFATAAGLVATPKDAKTGRVIKHLYDDELEAAA